MLFDGHLCLTLNAIYEKENNYELVGLNVSNIEDANGFNFKFYECLKNTTTSNPPDILDLAIKFIC